MVSFGFTAECKRCAKIVRKFIRPGIRVENKPWNPDQYIPEDIFIKAKGLAIFTVFKAGFLWGGCVGTGLVLTRLPNGGWSAPSAIALGGISFGAQIGGEVIYLVILLNTNSAVKAFSHGGNLTLGGQLSVSAGPYGRTGEVKGSARNFAALYSYSKSKGLFAGISIEGTIVTERTNTNQNFYKRRIKAKEILNGSIPVPSQAQDLIQALSPWTSTASIPSTQTSSTSFTTLFPSSSSPPNVSTTTVLPVLTTYPPPPSSSTSTSATTTTSKLPFSSSSSTIVQPLYESSRKPLSLSDLSKITHMKALYDFPGESPSDLTFRKGDIITVMETSGELNSWWMGQCHGRKGMFPTNYCEPVHYQ